MRIYNTHNITGAFALGEHEKYGVIRKYLRDRNTQRRNVSFGIPIAPGQKGAHSHGEYEWEGSPPGALLWACDETI